MYTFIYNIHYIQLYLNLLVKMLLNVPYFYKKVDTAYYTTSLIL